MSEIMKKDDTKIVAFTSNINFSDLKINEDSLIPVIVQDFNNNEVLMMAWMDEAAFNKTHESGIMTYYSRSRGSMWIKGESSGHYQYIREMYMDCDKDTLLAKVEQIGAACHTNNRSCFYRAIFDRK